MTPAAFLQTETPREAFVSARRGEGTFRAIRSPRRPTQAFIGDAQAPLFHAWRP